VQWNDCLLVNDRRIKLRPDYQTKVRKQSLNFAAMAMVENRCSQLSLMLIALLFVIATNSVVSGQPTGEWLISESQLTLAVLYCQECSSRLME
jgi:hypothetical protein